MNETDNIKTSSNGGERILGKEKQIKEKIGEKENKKNSVGDKNAGIIIKQEKKEMKQMKKDEWKKKKSGTKNEI